MVQYLNSIIIDRRKCFFDNNGDYGNIRFSSSKYFGSYSETSLLLNSKTGQDFPVDPLFLCTPYNRKELHVRPMKIVVVVVFKQLAILEATTIQLQLNICDLLKKEMKNC